MRAYERLTERFHRRSAISGAVAMLQWDRAAMMPAGGASARAEQVAVLETLAHGLIADPAVAEDLAAAEGEDLAAAERADLREMRHAWVHAAAVPSDLVAALARAGAACEMAWRAARAAADFPAVLPGLSALLALVREEAAATAEALGVSPYDALLDAYEPGGKSAEIDAVFADLAAFLPGFLDEVLAVQAARPAPLPLTGKFPVAAQRAFVRTVMTAMGFDFAHGRLDESAHPFCGGIADDVRLTTRYAEADAFTGIFGVIHETGHALYERGLPEAWRGLPAGEARGMSVHESQSLTMEMQAGRGRAFLSWLAPAMAAAFGGTGPAWAVENFVALAQTVERGFIRVEADEVTYPAHVILRYRLERAMIAGDLALADLPGAWDEGMRELLGVAPPDDALGCLQDIHWYDGAWGYFPTYTLGAMTAAQLFAAAKAAEPGLEAALARGDFSPLLGWMRTNVHAHGSLLETPELLTRATGAPLSAEAFKAHLRARYVEGA
ncbi:carboxypeptidase M32 [Oleispirillum naphthae]|uniref:carboxypeptidase M32 n=1 Tax=Oleispirillum naphthae TaxID=2838853 RepID=UPI003B68197B